MLHSSGARNFVEVSATVSQIDQLFQTSIGSYRAKGTAFVANATAPSVPAGLHVLTVMGLNTLIHPTTPLTGATHANPAGTIDSVLGTSTSPAALNSIAGEGSLLGSITGTLGVGGLLGKTAAGTPTIPASLSPQNLWSVYDMPSNNTGQGQSVAVMGSGDSSTTVKDLAIFERQHGLPTVPVTVTDIPKDGNFSDTGGNVEWELDTQASTGMAPAVRQVHLYFAEHLIDPNVESDFATWVDDPEGPEHANASFGECETTPANATLESTIPAQFDNNQDQNALYGTGAPSARAGRRPDAASGRARGTHPVRVHRRHRILVPGARARPAAGSRQRRAQSGRADRQLSGRQPLCGGRRRQRAAPRQLDPGAARPRVPVALHRRRPELLRRRAGLPEGPGQRQPAVPVRPQRHAQHEPRHVPGRSPTPSRATSPPARITSTPTSSAAAPARAARASPRR